MQPPFDPAFPFAEYQRRVRQVQAAMASRDLRGLFLRHRADVTYLTGLENAYMTAFHAVYVPVEGEPTIFASDFEMLNAGPDVWWADRVTFEVLSDPLEVVRRAILERQRGKGRLGVEAASLSFKAYRQLEAGLPGLELVPADDLLANIKVRKSPAEIAYMREAGRLSRIGIEAAEAACAVGKTDNAVAATSYQAMVAAGCEFQCVEPFVSAGYRSGIPHSAFRRTTLQPGDAVLIEVGGCMRRYTSPLMRTVVLAPVSPEIQAAVDGCGAGLQALLENMRPGIVAKEAARRARLAWLPICENLIWHGIYAYSVGLGFPPDWNDAPHCITADADFLLEPGMCFHATTSLREPGRYGAARSETVLITETGHELLTS